MENRLTRDYFLAQSWGPELVREFDLVIASNILDMLRAKGVLYNDLLDARIAAFCQPLDCDLDIKYLGLIDIPKIEGEMSYETHRRQLAKLANHPRGHWAIYHNGEGFDAWMSNGVGGTSTQSGHKFQHKQADHPFISFEGVYASAFSTMSYYRREEIENDIIFASVEAANLQVGDTFKHVHMKNRTWNAIYLGTAPSPHDSNKIMFKIRASRRGVKTAEYLLDRRAIFGMLKIDLVMPEAYRDEGNTARCKSLFERRTEAAQGQWDRLIQPDISLIERMKVVGEFDRADEAEFNAWGSKAPFKVDGDRLYRTAYTQPSDVAGPTYTYLVTFAPESDRIISSSIISKDESITNTVLDELRLAPRRCLTAA